MCAHVCALYCVLYLCIEVVCVCTSICMSVRVFVCVWLCACVSYAVRVNETHVILSNQTQVRAVDADTFLYWHAQFQKTS